jgi:ArsR family metal-binding transcriptional regulator
MSAYERGMASMHQARQGSEDDAKDRDNFLQRWLLEATELRADDHQPNGRKACMKIARYYPTTFCHQ